ncbi:hypothetical protein IEQ34_005033 [Dendrobium chrysotoxum]|uniref:Amino acid transporter transmembrane domain-containing protein n=1 Tax=Dendrobium chrysotoxum TaxID=161865 RepID=A0AAV7HBS7_DENCH|nr:hypothetical protein IEQ34_005033 [Dendrobium chrysotoxum]
MEEKMECNQNISVESISEADQKQLDAGALFVLKSKGSLEIIYVWRTGSWLHCGYHLTTSIVAPGLLTLPYALAKMGWAAGVVYLLVAAVVTFYSYNLISLVLEHHAQQGNRLLRFRDLARLVLG